MNGLDSITGALKRHFCGDLEFSSVPLGYAVNTGFRLPDGDPLSFYIVPEDGGLYHIEDDGTALPDAIAAGLDLKSPIREQLLHGILFEEGARFDADFGIRTSSMPLSQLGPAAMRFAAALIRMRDLSLLDRQNVAASFADDVRRSLIPNLPDILRVDEAASIDPGSADIVLRHSATDRKAARIFAAGSDLRIQDAMIEYLEKKDGDSEVIAVVDRRRSGVTERRFNNAMNKGLPMAVMDSTESSWIPRVLQVIEAANRQSQPRDQVI